MCFPGCLGYVRFRRFGPQSSMGEERVSYYSCCRANAYPTEHKRRPEHRGTGFHAEPCRNILHEFQRARILAHGKDRQDRLQSADDIRLKVRCFRRVPIFRVAEGHDHVDGKAVKSPHEITRFSFCATRTKSLSHHAGSNQRPLSPAAN